MKTYKSLEMFTKQTDDLKKLIAEHPDYPIVVLVANEVVADDDWGWWYAPSIRFGVGEILDCGQTINDEKVYTDRDDFEEDVQNLIADDDESSELSDEEFDKKVQEIIKEYEPYWKNVICIYADV